MRLHEDSAPTGNEKTRRIQFINEGGRSITRKHYWWWTEAETVFSSVANQQSYDTTDGFPSDIRGSSILEVRFNDSLYTPVLQTEAFSLENSTYSGFDKKYMIFNREFFPIPPFESTVNSGVSIKYYCIWSELSSDSDTAIIPDDFVDILVAFCLARIYSITGKRGSAADAYDEFNEIYKEMEVEQNNYLFALKSSEGSEEALYE